MNANHQPLPDREPDEARLTAYALGELAGQEGAEVERLVAGSPAAQRAVTEIQRLAGALRQPAEPVAPPASLLSAIETRLNQETVAMTANEAKPRKNRTWLYVVAGVAAAGLAVALVLPAGWGPRGSGRDDRPLAANTKREPSERDGKVGLDAMPTDEGSSVVPGGQRGIEKQGAVFDELIRTEADRRPMPDEPPLAYPSAEVWREAGRGSASQQKPTAPPSARAPAEMPASERAPMAGAVPMELKDLGVEKAPRDDLLRALGDSSKIVKLPDGSAVRRDPAKAGTGALAFPPTDPMSVGTLIDPAKSQLQTDYALTARARDALSSTESVVPADPRMRPFNEEEAKRKGDAGSVVVNGATMPAEQYEQLVENRFQTAHDHPLSTFSIDVDTASYANVRRFLTQGMLPPPPAVRIEEMVNYFRYDYSPPTGRTPFAVHLDTAECPWNGTHRLVRIGLKGKEIDRSERGPSNLVFLLDVSGSMSSEDKLPLVKAAMTMLVDQLTEDDHVAIVTYASGSGIRLHPTNGTEKSKIRGAIEGLYAGGSTHGSAGIQDAYNLATQHFIKGGVNRVIWATDGDLNVGITGDEPLVELITEKAKTGVFLTVLGVGTGNLKDAKLEKMADKGNGVYAYLDTIREAQKVLVEQMTGSLVTIAKDVKIQVEFNPAEVRSYRLVGYENRVMANKDFRDDTKDAGEIGAGHTVTALYEIVPAKAAGTAERGESAPEATGLKYQKPGATRELTDEANSGELLTVRLRYKEPDGDEATEFEAALTDQEKRFGAASADFRFAASVAAFGLVLRQSEFRGDLTLAAVEEFAAGALGKDEGGYRAEFVNLVRKARQISGR